MATELNRIIRSKVIPNLPIITILFLSLLMRLYTLGEMSLSNDELSGVWRSFMQHSWHDMIVNGVMTDGHPPLTCIIMRYWMMVFGDSVWSIRAPFVIAGVLGLYYMYRTGVLWFGSIAALLSVSLLSVMSYTIYYHQIARPYSLGFLWVQAAAFYWTQFLFGEMPKGKKRSLILWVIMSVLACYTHYFSFMAVGLIGLTGLFFVNKNNIVPYLLSGLIITLFLCPGFIVFKQQLSYNGLEWLSAPSRDWLIGYLADVNNKSPLIYWTLGIFFLTSIFIGSYKCKLAFSKFQLVGLSWFLISFGVGYFKSVYSMPVLQNSCLIFTYPFLVLVFFSFWRDLPSRGFAYISYLSILILVIVGYYDTVYRDRYYTSEHHGELKGLAVRMAGWVDHYKSDIMLITNVNNDYYWNYYWQKTLHRREKIAMYGIDPNTDIPAFDSLLAASKTHYCTFAWSNIATPDTLFKVIKTHYPYLLADSVHFNSGIRLYTK